MKFIDWFAGVGGFRRGMELAGHECVGFCEFDKFATASYISMLLAECWKCGKQKESKYSGIAVKRFTTGGCRTQMF